MEQKYILTNLQVYILHRNIDIKKEGNQKIWLCCWIVCKYLHKTFKNSFLSNCFFLRIIFLNFYQKLRIKICNKLTQRVQIKVCRTLKVVFRNQNNFFYWRAVSIDGKQLSFVNKYFWFLKPPSLFLEAKHKE